MTPKTLRSLLRTILIQGQSLLKDNGFAPSLHNERSMHEREAQHPAGLSTALQGQETSPNGHSPKDLLMFQRRLDLTGLREFGSLLDAPYNPYT